ncbi:MAG: ABC transporter permease [Chloroflexi bacterium]|nr:MAG: ABC transporter permease [Chloroflexota bacterium]TMB77112.1 MAG: ABC transporter permease [Chloroflexota bacterium]TMB95104.1 MAG: ABC transporter permease [Chloroflexota bacterium]TMC30305.1 MAG: ABC transporter permease [Chloroflexota bacterium]TMC34578.1 MAG: ABC transporter permease [Chloroflexota bacterium]
MRGYVLRRIAYVVPVLLGVVTVVFLALRLIPGDPAVALAGEKASAAQIEQMREALGLNRPLPVQYVDFVAHLVRGDLGRSIRTGGDIRQELVENFAPTIELSIAALVIALAVGLPAGVLAALRRRTLIEYVTMIGSLVGISMPVFWIGLMLIYWLGARAEWFPLSGTVSAGLEIPARTHFYTVDGLLTGNVAVFADVVWHLVLPAITLSTITMAIVSRMARSSMLEVLGSEYLVTARAKGLRDRAVVLGHALKNALIPVVTVVGLQLGALLSGAVLTETVFGRVGVGRYVLNAITARDYPVVQATVIVVAIFVALISIIVDLVYAMLDPRIRYR